MTQGANLCCVCLRCMFPYCEYPVFTRSMNAVSTHTDYHGYSCFQTNDIQMRPYISICYLATRNCLILIAESNKQKTSFSDNISPFYPKVCTVSFSFTLSCELVPQFTTQSGWKYTIYQCKISNKTYCDGLFYAYHLRQMEVMFLGRVCLFMCLFVCLSRVSRIAWNLY